MKKFIIGIALVFTPVFSNTAMADGLTDFQVTNRMVEYLESSQEMMELAIKLEAAKARYANAKIGYDEMKATTDYKGKLKDGIIKSGIAKDYNKLVASHREALAEYKVYQTRKQVASK